MKTYLDATVLVALAFDQKPRLSKARWSRVVAGGVVSSRIIRVECLRVLDRVRLRDESEYERRRPKLLQLLAPVDVALLEESVLAFAEQPLPTKLWTLDALHLATAVLVRQAAPDLRALATHDVELAAAARAVGFEVVGA